MAYTTTDLLNAISRRSFAPTGQRTFTPAELLQVADEMVETHLVPEIAKVREEFFVSYVDYAVEAGKNAYDIPARAAGMVVREIWWVDPSGAVTPDFTRYEPEEISSTTAGMPTGFYLRANSIILDKVPAATTGATIRVFFILNPSRHVATSDAAVISAINGTVVTVSSIPAAWVTGHAFDLIRQDGGQEPRALDLTSTLVSGTDITLPSVPSSLRVGDYIALAGETPLVQLPANFRTALAQAVAMQILGDMSMPGADRAEKAYEKIMEKNLAFITPRVQGEDRTVTPANW